MPNAPDTVALRSVERTLQVLRAVNDEPGAGVSALAQRTGIPRPSLYRILGTLCTLGYVQRVPNGDGYAPTILVRSLSDGFNDEAWVKAAALPVMEELQREVVWPTDIASFFDDAMYLRETTRRSSPLTVDNARVGLRLPMLLSATGRAYLSFCSDAERRAIVDRLRRSRAPEDALARDPRFVSNLVRTTRRKGYGERHGELFEKTGAIAVPVMRGERVLCCLNISFIASALMPAEAAARYLAPLKAAAQKIARQLDVGSG